MKNNLLKLLSNNENRIIGNRNYSLAAVLIGIVNLDEKEYILFEKRASHIRQGGEISLPGGKFDTNDKSTKNTAIRETIEEIGISRNKIEILGKFGSLVTASGIILDTYVGYLKIKDISELNFNSDEVEKLFLVPIDFFIKSKPRIEKIEMRNIPKFSTEELSLPKIYENSWTGYFRNVYFYKYQGELIWGITSEIIYDFVQNYG